jgi:MFS family permease
MAALLRRRDFRSLWLAGSISDAGDWLLRVALPIAVFAATGSALGTAAAFLCELAPGVALAPLAGRLAEGADRRRLLLTLSLLQAAGLVPLLFVGVRGHLSVVYAVILVQAALAALFDPARNALLPTLVPARDVVAANSLVGLSENVGRLVGGPLGGVLLATAGLPTVVAVDGLSYLLAAALIARLATIPTDSDAHPGTPTAAPAASRARLRAALRRPTIRAVVLVGGVGEVAQGIFVVTFVIFVADRLHGGAGEIGLLRGVQAVGAIGAGLVLGMLARRVSPAVLTAGAAAAFGLLELALWNAPAVSIAEPLYVVLFTLVGAPGLLLVTGMTSYAQTACPPGERGRTFAALGMVGNAGGALGMLLAGVFTGALGLTVVLEAQAALYLAAGALAALLMVARPGSRSGDGGVGQAGHPGEPLGDDRLGLGDDPLDQLATRRDVVNQALAEASAPDAGVRVARLVDLDPA